VTIESPAITLSKAAVASKSDRIPCVLRGQKIRFLREQHYYKSPLEVHVEHYQELDVGRHDKSNSDPIEYVTQN
jgi:hypothetical protein